MIEQAIFSSIGFLVAALLALAAAPAITRRARRLAEARARLQAPLTETQAIAERDALRAEHAIEQFRLERRLQALEEIAARRAIEIGRQASRIAVLEGDSGERAAEVAARRQDLDALERESQEVSGQLGALQLALRDATLRREAAEAAAAAAQAGRAEVETLGDRNRLQVATLQTRISALEVRTADAERIAAAATAAADAQKARLSAALADLAAAGERAERLEADLAASRARLRETDAQLARIAERDAAPREREMGGLDLVEQLSRAAAAPATSTAGVRDTGEPLENPIEAASDDRGAGDRALREAIARLGRDVARLKGRVRGGGADASNLVTFDRREPQPHAAGSAEAAHAPPAGKIRHGQPMAPEI